MEKCSCLAVQTPRLQEVILSPTVEGKGTPENPSRIVIQVHCPHGRFIAKDDPFTGSVPTGLSQGSD